MKPALTKADNSIRKLDERNESYKASKHPLLGVLRNLHKDYLRDKGNLSEYCKTGSRQSGTWKVSAKDAGNTIKWSLVLNGGMGQGNRTCTFIGGLPGQRKRSTFRKSLPNVSRPQLPKLDRLRSAASVSSKPKSRKKAAIVSKPQLPKKDLQRERRLKVLAPVIAAAYYARMGY